MPCVVLSGMPGTGKTAIAIAQVAITQGKAALVLHTDLLKHWLRAEDPQAMAGPGYGGNFLLKAAIARPWLQRQAAKADRDGEWLIVEGTLAANFFPHGGFHMRLHLPDPNRQHRLQRKPVPAQRSLQTHDLVPYRNWLTTLADHCHLQIETLDEPAVIAATLFTAWRQQVAQQ